MNIIGRWPPLNCLRGFESAARLGSFSKAANELNMTQSAISHQIKTLEDYLGQILFIRVKRKVVLSDAGTDFLATTENCLNILNEGLKRLEQYKKPNQVVVHSDSAFASNWLVSRLSGFRELYPDTDIWLDTTEGEPDLEHSEVDLSILYGSGRWPGLSKTRLIGDVLVPLCAPDHPIQAQAMREPLDLLDHNLLHGEQEESWNTWFASIGLADTNPITGPNFSCPVHLLQAAELGQGIALGSLILAADQIESGKLVSPVYRGIRSRNAYYLVARYEGLESSKLAVFSEWLMQQAERFTTNRYRSLESRYDIK